MKTIIAVLVIAAVSIVTGCTKQASKELASDPVKMNFDQVEELLGYGAAAKIFKVDYNPVLRGPKPRASANATVLVWLNDLTLTATATSQSGPIPGTTLWAGVQKAQGAFVNDSITSACNNNYWWSTPPSIYVCNDQAGSGTTFYRLWTTDPNGDVHTSAVETVTVL